MKQTFAFMVVVLYTLAIMGCTPEKPDYSNATAFINDFVSALNESDVSRFDTFFFKRDDFDLSVDGSEMARERIMGIVRQEFLRQCNSFVKNFGSREFTVEDISLQSSKPRAVRFLNDVGEQYSQVEVTLNVEDEFALRLVIDEIVQVGSEWRLSTFLAIVDYGTEEVEPIHIPGEEK